MDHLPSDLNLSNNIIVRITEDIDYISNELKFYINLCHKRKDQGDPFFNNGCIWGDVASGYLSDFLKELNTAAEENVSISHIVSRNARRLSKVPDMIQNVIIQYMSRRPKSPRNFGYLSKAGLSINEMHPDFNETIRAIEAVNNFTHLTTQNFYNQITNIPPILAISTHNNFSLVKFPADPSYHTTSYKDVIKDDGVKLKKILDWVSTLSWITVPRWMPSSIRDTTILAHEHFHRVTTLCRFHNQILTSIPRADENGEENFIKISDNLFDKETQKLAVSIIELNKLAKNMILKNRKFWFDRIQYGIVNDDSLSALVAIKNSYAMRVTSAQFCEELVCDLFAFIIFGPAYSFTLLHLPTIFTVSTIINTQHPLSSMSHPPIQFRLLFQAQLLKQIGFEEIANQIENNVNSIISKSFIQSELSIANSATENFKNWMKDSHSLIDHISNIIIKQVDADTKLYLRDHPTYQDWLRENKRIINSIKNGDVFSCSRETIPDILNALWWKVIACRDCSGLHTAWRTILSRKL